MPKGKKAEIKITGINHLGEGVGRLDGLVVFVPGTVPGERVYIHLVDVRRSYARGALLEILKPSHERVTPGCAQAEGCGGCALQHIAYPEQLRLKTQLVRQTLARNGGIRDALVRDITGLDDPWHYRNNLQFKAGRDPGGIKLGFYARKSHRLVYGPKGNACLLAHGDLNRVAEAVRVVLDKLPPGSPVPEQIALRRGETGEIMVILAGYTNVKKGHAGRNRFNTLAEKIASIRDVVSVVELVRPWKKKHGSHYVTLAGKEYILDRLEGLKFRISGASFYQVNPAQTRVLYRKALEFCGLQGNEEVADAYCGVGTIALYVARYVKDVRGYEVESKAVEDARANANLNGIRNARFYAGAAEKVLPQHVGEGYRPDVVVLDPPRAGCRPKVLEAVAQSGARRVVYVSCDPATLARDIYRLTGKGYTLQEVQPVDMFPHTPHVECVALIERE